MTPSLVRSDGAGISHDDLRMTTLWYRINNVMGHLITPEIWISELKDHKGCLCVTWSVKPTAQLKKWIDDIWKNEFDETQTEHIYELS